MAFRRKSSERALEEIRAVTKSSGIFRWMATDNIIDMSYFRDVLPALAQDSQPYEFFYETKANLTKAQVEVMADAGCRVIQPGVESLHDETLDRMRKGTTAAQNIQLLKNCMEAGVLPIWSILCGFPGSDPTAVWGVAKKLPLLAHLPPPNGTTPIRFDRFSPYHSDPESFGITLEPVASYQWVYGVSLERAESLAYFFGEADGDPDIARFALKSLGFANEWRESFWGTDRPELVFLESPPGEMMIRDTRRATPQDSHRLKGNLAVVLRMLGTPVSHRGLGRRLESADDWNAGKAELESCLMQLEEAGLIWVSAKQLVGLVTEPPRRAVTADLDRALGKVRWRKVLSERSNFLQRFG
jgi:ribosomal peptide maturation radical SAM protein 1